MVRVRFRFRSPSAGGSVSLAHFHADGKARNKKNLFPATTSSAMILRNFFNFCLHLSSMLIKKIKKSAVSCCHSDFCGIVNRTRRAHGRKGDRRE